MNKVLLSFTLLLLTACSFDTKSGIWTEKKGKLNLENNKSTQVFAKEKILEKEFNPNIKIILNSKLVKNSSTNNLNNNWSMWTSF